MQGSKLYVGNLQYSVGDDQLRELMANYGEVKSVNIIEGKGFGFVEFEEPDQAEAAMEALNGTDFAGRTLRIDEARPRKNRPPRRGNYSR
ncbi:MAG: RNA-binding protein [candidate division Zixibacteria bacterium]|nr:RNA-binding protein [candidate division Zixibacteria bacterium]